MDTRSVSPVVGAVLLLAVVLLLIAAAGVVTVSLSEDALGTATVHSQGQYDIDIENRAGQTLTLSVNAYQERDPDTEFRVRINGRTTYRWDGETDLEMTCFYPGDRLFIYTAAGDTTYPVTEFTVEEPTDCDRYTTFRNKFEYGVINGGSYTIRDEYDFRLGIEPNGDDEASDNNGDNDENLDEISLQNEWHHIERFDRELEGVEPPVFLIVMVDNVHWTDVPDPSLGPVPSGQYYNWTDSPPGGLNPGADSFNINGDDVEPVNEDRTEPTNDIYVLFKPGCDQSEVVFIDESAGYDNRIYQDGSVVIDNTNDASIGESFTAPGLECPEGLTWES